MNPERWGQIERLYHAALEREPKERGKFLADACGDDTELCSKLESLLARTKTAEAFLEKPVIGFAAPGLVEDDARHESEHRGRSPRPPWWMYVNALAFVARAVFI